jgi:hypothetical protein
MAKRPIDKRAWQKKRYAAAAADAKTLYERLADAVHSGQVDNDFARLAARIEALPLTVERGRLGFLRNWAASARGLWASGQIGACRYQVRQIGRLLDRLRQGDE